MPNSRSVFCSHTMFRKILFYALTATGSNFAGGAEPFFCTGFQMGVLRFFQGVALMPGVLGSPF